MIFSPCIDIMWVQKHGPTWSINVDIFNLLNSRVEDIAYYYASRLRNEPPGPEGEGTTIWSSIRPNPSVSALR
jgi:hypothetical protein